MVVHEKGADAKFGFRHKKKWKRKHEPRFIVSRWPTLRFISENTQSDRSWFTVFIHCNRLNLEPILVDLHGPRSFLETLLVFRPEKIQRATDTLIRHVGDSELRESQSS